MGRKVKRVLECAATADIGAKLVNRGGHGCPLTSLAVAEDAVGAVPPPAAAGSGAQRAGTDVDTASVEEWRRLQPWAIQARPEQIKIIAPDERNRGRMDPELLDSMRTVGAFLFQQTRVRGDCRALHVLELCDVNGLR